MTPRLLALTPLALTLTLLLPAASAWADPASRAKLTEILSQQDVAADPLRLLHALGSQDLSLERGDLVRALAESQAPRAARNLLSVTERLESRSGGVRMERTHANGAEAPDGRILAFGDRLAYRVYGGDLVGIRGLAAAPSPTEAFAPLTSARDVVPAPAPAPQPEEEAGPALSSEVSPSPSAELPAAELPASDTPAPVAASEVASDTPAPLAAPERATATPGAIGVSQALNGALSLGARGDQVRALQERLNAHRPKSAAALSEDGQLGTKTSAAVEDFQRRRGLPVTGQIDAATRRALEAEPPLARGAEGRGVQDLQDLLNRERAARGLPPLARDGKFGPATEAALRDHQAATGLRATGEADAATLAGLRGANLSSPSSATPLRAGSEGQGVRDLQERLNAHRRAAGQAPIAADGKFGPATQRALEEFQRGRRLETSGEGDAATAAALAAAPARPRLTRGDEGDATKALQARLNQHRRAAGLAPIAEDGKFGAGTEGALQEFQRAKGLPEGGALTPETSAALDQTPTPAATLASGDEGPRVAALQKDLNAHRLAKGQPAISEDGKFGPSTKRALEDFQGAEGLPKTGQADPATLSAADTPPSSSTSQPAIQASQSELEVLARIVKGECPAAMPWEGKVAVAAVVLNRVRSRSFPNSIIRVAHQPSQFSCYNPRYRRQLYEGPIPDYAWRAARAALAGQDPSRGATFYFNPYLVNPSWKRGKIFVRRIENAGSAALRRQTAHDFYRTR